ncbi:MULTISPECIES: hypothetical protein [Streptomyces]|uniref:CdiI immunity protein domain-containing protein n=1 Tax=Streptomyces clavifer TaxID=68188 RepID=A0ABS4VBG2_9ACTN|nr:MULTISPECIES: hypothetical protein [Streptomyces]MBP2361260.1 hypothetical protein [Streptomyces clavifer]MDX2748515.1 hypothetical protein [Streptomyces sp. NRRL_B-2557]GHA94174.1 hypothetical protein GCM10010392_20980 [Streptomyces clavifer]
MDARFKNFLKIYLDLEQGYDTSGCLRSTLLSFNDSYVELIQTEFEQIISDESFGPAEYEQLTDIGFPDRESLRIYLRAMRDYLFNDAPEQSMPPG